MIKEKLAYEMAVNYHGNQMYGTNPYKFHLKDVRNVLIEFGQRDENILCASYLHDVLEDTDFPLNQIFKEFGQDVLWLVWSVSGFGANRKEKAIDAYRKINLYPKAAILKAADRIANTRSSKGTDLGKMYLKDWPFFKESIGHLIPENMMIELKNLYNDVTSITK